MHYHLSDHIYIAQFQDNFILLDTKKDKYTVCFKQLTDLFSYIFDEKPSYYNKSRTSFSHLKELPQQDLDFIQKLLEDNFIECKPAPYPFHIDRKLTSYGVSNVDWRLPLENEKIYFNIKTLNALFTLIKVNFYMKFKGFYKTIQLIKKACNLQVKYITPQSEELRTLANIVNTACILYPKRTKCLEWAMTFILLALKRGWQCNLEIGVQNYPFFAHAWVECDGKVVMDSQSLRDGLAIILNEPFRKLRI